MQGFSIHTSLDELRLIFKLEKNQARLKNKFKTMVTKVGEFSGGDFQVQGGEIMKIIGDFFILPLFVYNSLTKLNPDRQNLSIVKNKMFEFVKHTSDTKILSKDNVDLKSFKSQISF